MAKGEYSGVMFELKESEGGRPWLLAAFDEPGLSCVAGNDLLGLKFRDEVTFDQAKEFRSLLQKMIKGISYTKL